MRTIRTAIASSKRSRLAPLPCFSCWSSCRGRAGRVHSASGRAARRRSRRRASSSCSPHWRSTSPSCAASARPRTAPLERAAARRRAAHAERCADVARGHRGARRVGGRLSASRPAGRARHRRIHRPRRLRRSRGTQRRFCRIEIVISEDDIRRVVANGAGSARLSPHPFARLRRPRVSGSAYLDGRQRRR